MRFYNISGLDQEIHAKFYEHFKPAPWNEAEILLCGPEELKKPLGRNFRYLVCNMTNIDHIRVPKRVKVIKLEGTDLFWVRSTAEHAIYLMLSLVKRKHRGEAYGKVLAGKSLGIIGYGRVGKQVEKIAESFDMDVYVMDSPRMDEDYNIHRGFVLDSDFISIHASVEGKAPIFGSKELNLVRDGAYLINTARPCLIDEKALIKHIDRLGGFASDFKVSPLLALREKVVVTEHTGGYTIDDLIRTSEICYEKLRRVMNEDKNEK